MPKYIELMKTENKIEIRNLSMFGSRNRFDCELTVEPN